MSGHQGRIPAKVDRVLDLSGEVCPYTFVRAKLELETMAPGEVLELTVDGEPSVRDVPRSLTGAGHLVLAIEALDDRRVAIVVRKGDPRSTR